LETAEPAQSSRMSGRVSGGDQKHALLPEQGAQMTYRVFIGDWRGDGEPDWVSLDVGGLSWEGARQMIAAPLRRIEQDNCPCCAGDAAEALARLMAMPPGRFEAQVDGDDYVIEQNKST
jgi:hypothetical protein